VGFADIDNQGQSGLELANDSLLSGANGWADIRRDGLRNTFRVREQALVQPSPGESLVLTVDFRLQEIVEEELAAAVEKHNAKSAIAAFVDCNNGEILALAHYDPDEQNRSRPFKLRAVTDQFEPGSSYKVFTAAALLDAGLIDFSDSTYCEKGRWKIGRRTLRDDKELEWLNFRSIFELSSNIGIGKRATELGGEALYETALNFGFGARTLVGMPGEGAGQIARPGRWSDFNVASLAMGHGVAVTALQMATAVASVANGGKLYRPRLTLGVVDDGGYVIERTKPELIGRPLLQSSADSLRTFMRGVVENGTAEPVNSQVIAIAGKTGTPQMPNLEEGGYYWNRYMGNFVGFFPYEKPAIAGFVVIENPQPVHYGGHTAGPAFRKIAERYAIHRPELLGSHRLVVAQESDQIEQAVEAPDLVGREVATAIAIAEELGLRIRCDGDAGSVTWQYPAADRLILKGDEILLAASDTGAASRMSDLTGLSIREASAYLSFRGIKYRVNGNGRVVSQSIKPGGAIAGNTALTLQCQTL
jgi:cell division protein FtsI (penicillin-binding protein 3)